MTGRAAVEEGNAGAILGKDFFDFHDTESVCHAYTEYGDVPWPLATRAGAVSSVACARFKAKIILARSLDWCNFGFGRGANPDIKWIWRSFVPYLRVYSA